MEDPGKRCCTCGTFRPLTDYNVRRSARDGRQSRCRPCSQQWYRDNAETHRANVRRNTKVLLARNRRLMTEYLLDHPCVDCGETDVRCLDFDHREGTEKVREVCKLVHNAGSWSRVLAEIEKCDVRCANCHRRVTAARGAWWRQSVHEQARAELVAETHSRLDRVFQTR